jgi:hypothetical protein
MKRLLSTGRQLNRSDGFGRDIGASASTVGVGSKRRSKVDGG